MNSLLALLSLVSAAHASSVSVTFCANYGVNYTDASASVGDDYFPSNTDKLARGARVKVIRNSDGVEVFNNYATSGANDNCTAGMTLDTALTYTVKIVADANVDGTNYVVVRNSATGNVWAGTVLSAYSPPGGGETKQITTALHEAWNVAAAAGWANHYRSGGMTGKTYEFRTGTSVGNSFQENGGSPFIYIQNDTYKYIVVHEMGHEVAFYANGSALGATTSNYSAAMDGCDTGTGAAHLFNTKEYQAAAMNEGLANWYAEITFNDTSSTECYYYRSSIDWDLDGSYVDDSVYIGCEQGPYGPPGSSSPIDYAKYLGDYCLATGQSNNRATQYDWMRFLWDLSTDQGLSSIEILNIWDGANAQSWTTSGNGTGAGYPATELRNSANALGLLTEWDNEDNLNGVHR